MQADSFSKELHQFNASIVEYSLIARWLDLHGLDIDPLPLPAKQYWTYVISTIFAIGTIMCEIFMLMHITDYIHYSTLPLKCYLYRT